MKLAKILLLFLLCALPGFSQTTVIGGRGGGVPDVSGPDQALMSTGENAFSFIPVPVCPQDAIHASLYSDVSHTWICQLLSVSAPGGAVNSIQYNNSGAFGGLAGVITGSTLNAHNGAAPSFDVPGISERTVTGATDTILCDTATAIRDRNAWIIYNRATAIAVTLPGPATSGCGTNFPFVAKNIGAGNVTVTPGGGALIDGNATLVITQGQHCGITSDNTNYFSRCNSGQITAGANITLTPSASGISIASSGGAGTGVGRFSGTLDFGSIPDGGYADLTFTATGVTTADVIAPGWPSALDAGLTGNMFVSAADTIKVRLTNLSGAAIDPASATFKATLAVYNLSGSSAIDFASIPDGGYLSNTFTLTGASTGDPVVLGLPSALPAGLTGSALVSAADTIKVTLTNLSGAAVDPASLTYKASIAK